MCHCVAVVLAAGRGKRMGSHVAKQFLEIAGKPVLYYSLKQLEESFVDEVVLVARESDVSFCRREIIEKYDFKKVSAVVAGGKERYHSVYNALCAIGRCNYVFIHDGARPFINEDIIRRNYEMVCKYNACVTGMPVKDTIKVSDNNGFVKETPRRESIWQIQTPQTFSYSIIKEAYDKLMKDEDRNVQRFQVTDDAMVAEIFGGVSVKLVEGDYRNIKITTPEDMAVAEAIWQTIRTEMPTN